MDAVTNYLDVFAKLQARKRWSTDVNSLRFAALTLTFAGDRANADRLEAAAETLKANARWTSPLRSSLRYSVAALILKADLDPARTHAAVRETRESFRAVKLARSGLSATMAALILVLREGGKPAPAERVRRMRAFYDAWRDAHFWLTGQDDYPMAALHALHDRDVHATNTTIENIYERTRAAKFSRGNQLQFASHLLALHQASPAVVSSRFAGIRDALRTRGIKTTSSHYDELALLTLTEGSPATVARGVEVRVAALRAVKPKPMADLAFTLATGLLLAEHAQSSLGTTDAAALQATQAALAAQQAAVMAAVIGASVATSVAATTAATS